jgi:hypothetical protein
MEGKPTEESDLWGEPGFVIPEKVTMLRLGNA